LICLLASSALAGCGNGEPSGDADADADQDADLDTGSDGDGRDADTETDDADLDRGDADRDGEAAADSDVTSDADRPVPECLEAVGPGDQRVNCLGLTFDVSVPEACATEQCGLVVDVHGLTMSGRMEDNNTDMRQLGREHGYVVIQPNAPGTAPATVWSTSHDDAVFEFMMRVVEGLGLDERRIHFTGFSQGGFMTWRFICDHADVLASAAPGAAGIGCGAEACAFEGAAMPSEEIPILFLAGRRDDNYIRFACTSAQRDAVIAAWGMAVDAAVAGDEMYDWTRYVNARGVVFETIEHDYVSSAEPPTPLVPRLLGHCFPGSDDPGDEPGQLFPFGCDPPNAVHWGEAAMDFFIAHPRAE
jgi:poly(3-hydroxybutyrate) depolymerase